MSIRYIKDKKRFVINTKTATYAFDIVLDRYLYHLYYGKRTNQLPDPVFNVVSFAPYLPGYGEAQSTDVFPQECSFYGAGDFRPNALRLNVDGTGVSDFVYDSYRIFKVMFKFLCSGSGFRYLISAVLSWVLDNGLCTF